ncbi:MAG: LysM peptidoglycan-binding domain-containing protein [Rhodocyclales bacterium]|nr:LysM peptidoglycan-binding domain-containing protein [Rhodocyclales bacterium]
MAKCRLFSRATNVVIVADYWTGIQMVSIVTNGGLGYTGSSKDLLGAGGQLGAAGLGQAGGQVTVNAKTGNLIVQQADEFIVGLGLDIGVVRTYNSQAAFDFDNNDGWQVSLYRKVGNLTGLVGTAGSAVTLYEADGRQLVYAYDVTESAYVNKDGAGAYDTLVFNSSNDTWLQQDGDSGIAATYQANPLATGEWHIASRSDRDGNTVSYTYDAASGLIDRITDANGDTTLLNYNAAKQLTSVQTIVGGLTLTRVRYTYDFQGRLESVSIDLTPQDGSVADGQVYTTTYTYAGTTTCIASIVNSDGSGVSFTYDAGGRVVTATDSAGKTTSYSYVNSTTTTVTDPLGLVTTLTYDTDGNLTRVEGPAGSNLDVRYAYSADGDLIQMTDSRGNATTYLYDSRGNLLRQQDAAGNVVERVFNVANQLVSETAYLQPDPDGAGGLQAAVPQTVRYVYDAEQHLRFSISAEGRIVEYRYNASGCQVSRIAYTGDVYGVTGNTPGEPELISLVAAFDQSKSQRTDTTYDARGMVSTVTRYAATTASGDGIVDGTESTTRYVYDAAGRLLQQIDPRGVATAGNSSDYLTSYAYDGLGRILSVTACDKDGNTVGVGTTAQTLTTYTDSSRRSQILLANGLVRVSNYDARGLLVSLVEQDSVGAVLSTTAYQYDANGRLRVTVDPTGQKTYLFYDEAGRVTATIDPAGALSETIYNANGQAVRTIRYAGSVSASLSTLFTEDADGVVVDVALATVRPAEAAAADRISYKLYDKAGRLVKSIDSLGYVTEYRYDGKGQIGDTIRYASRLGDAQLAALKSATLEIAVDDPNATPVADAANDRRTRSFYSADGLLQAVLDGEGYLVENQYDAAAQRIRTIRYATRTNSANWAEGGLETLRPEQSADDQVSRYFYDGSGRLVATLDAEGYLSESAYDVAGNIVSSVRYATQTSLSARANGALPDLRPGVAAEDRTTQYQYDANNRVLMTRSLPDDVLTVFTYDRSGNLLQMVSASGSSEQRVSQRSYDVQGRLIAEISGEGVVALMSLVNPTQTQIDNTLARYQTSYRYDAAGRRIATIKPDSIGGSGNATLFYYDPDGRLSHSINALGEVTEYRYDIFGGKTAEIRYANRIATHLLAGLTGGEASSLGTLLSSLSNPLFDRIVLTQYNQRGEVVGLTDALGNASQITRNAFGDAVGTVSPIAAGSSVVALFGYDRRGQEVMRTEDSGGINRLARVSYDAFGRVTQSIDPRGHTSSYTYDRLGRQLASRDQIGAQTVTTYDAFDRILTRTDALGHTVTHSYDSGARSYALRTAEGVVTTTTKNRHGETVSVSDGIGGTTSYTYDRDGRLLTVANVAGTAFNEYDAAGYLVRSVDAGGGATIYVYDAVGRVLNRIQDPAGLSLNTRYRYDAFGQVAWEQSPGGTWSRTDYDAKGQLVAVTLDPSSIPDPAGNLVSNPNGLNLVTAYSYDARGKKVTVTTGAGTPEARTTQYAYDKLGRRIQEVVDPGIGHLNLATSYAYDENDNLVSSTDPNGAVTRYFYDDANRLVYRLDSLGGLKKNIYDAAGYLVKTIAYSRALNGIPANPTMSDVESRIVVSVGQDRVERFVRDADGRTVFDINAQNQVSETRYDAAGRIVAQLAYATPAIVPDGASVADVRSVLQSAASDQTTASVYDAAGRVRYSVDAARHVTEYVRDANGHVIRQISYARPLPAGTPINAAATVEPNLNAIAQALQPDGANDRATRRIFDAVGRSVYEIDAENYVTETQYDAHGRIARTIRYTERVSVGTTPGLAEVGALVAAYAETSKQIQSFTYDAGGRLIQSADAGGFVERYTYDANGNRISFVNKKGAEWTYVYDANNRLVSENSPLTTVTSVSETLAVVQGLAVVETRITYDAVGNVLSRTEAYGRPEARTTRYEYDALGRQIVTVFPQVAVYSGDSLLTNGIDGTVSRTEQNVTPITQVTYDALGNAVVNKDAAGNYSYKVYDILGRVIYDVDAEHYVTEHRYDRFGNVKQTIRYARAIALGFTRSDPLTATEVTGLLVADGADRVLSNEYDDANRLVKVTEPATDNFDPSAPQGMQYFNAGRITTKRYNAAGQLIQQRVLKNPLTDTWVDTTFYYDRRGNKTAQVDALGYLTIWDYDESGDVVRQVEYAKALTPGSWSVDGHAAPEQTTPQNRPGSPIGYDRETRFAYDLRNQKVSETRINVEYASTSGALGINTLVGDLVTRYTYDGIGNLTSTTDAAGVVSYIYYDALGRKIAIAAPTRSSDTPVGTVYMPPLSVVYPTAANTPIKLSFNRSEATGTVATLRYRVKGSTGAWVAASLAIVGNTYTADLPASNTERYEYELAYTRNGEAQAYAVGTGDVSIYGTTAAGTVNAVAGVVRDNLEKIDVSSAYAETVGDGESGYWNQWAGSNSVSLTWSSLDGWGVGDVRVRVEYVTGNLNGGGGVATAREFSFANAVSLKGVQVGWSDGTTDTYGGISSVTSVKVWKRVNGQEVLVHSGGTGGSGNRLVLQGNTAGVTGISIVGIGTRSVTALPGGAFSVAIDDLPRGVYGYTLVGSSAAGGSFEIKDSSVAGTPVVQELISAASMQLGIANLPADTISASLKYRRVGDSAGYLTKPLAQSAGVWRAAYEDMASGRYEYVVDVVRTGGATASYAGTVTLMRGAQSLPVVSVTGAASAQLTPLTEFRLDIYGNVVQQVDYAKGAVAANEASYGLVGLDAVNDKSQFTFFDTHGHVVRSVDAEGASTYSSYDVLGRQVKEWQPIEELALFTQRGATYGNGSIVKTESDSYENSRVFSSRSYLGGASVSATAGQTNLLGMFGLTLNPSLAPAYGSLDYAWTFTHQGKLQIVERGTLIGEFGSYTTSDVLSVTYDGSNVRYMQNGVVKRTVAAGAGLALYADTNFYSKGFKLDNIRFEPIATPELVPGSGVTVSGGTITRASGAGWNADAYSKDSYTGRAHVSATVGQTNMYGMFGLNSDPILDQSYTSLDYAWEAIPGGTLVIYENGTYIGSFGTYTTSDVLSITYEGTNVVYRQNGVVKRTVVTTANRTFHFDSSLYNTGFKFNNVQFSAAPGSGPIWQRQNAVRLFEYDRTGHQTATVEPSYLPNRTLSDVATGLTLVQASVSSTVTASAYYYQEAISDGEGGYYYETRFSSTSSIRVDWNNQSELGSGDVMVTVDYVRASGGAASVTQTFAGSGAYASASLSWSDSGSAYGISSVTRTRVWKKDTSGNWVQIHDRSANGAYGSQIMFATPEKRIGVSLRYRLLGATSWTTATLGALGAKCWASLAGVANGTYEYELLYTGYNDSAPSNVGTGRIVINGSTGSVTNNNVLSPTALNAADFVRTQSRYNAFGEIVAKGVNDGWQERYDYDNAGTLWRSKGSDGVTHVFLRDGQGNTTAEIQSQQLDLGTYANAAQVAALTTGIQRSEVAYDLLGHAIQRTLAPYTLDRSVSTLNQGLSLNQVSVGFSTSSSVAYTVDESGGSWSGSSAIYLNWTDIGAWGPGNVYVQVDYVTASTVLSNGEGGYVTISGTSTSRSVEISAAAGAGGTTISWTDTGSTYGGIGSISRVRVSKKNAANQWVLVHDRSVSGANGNIISWPTPAALDTTVQFKYRLVGASTWTTGTVANMGSRYIFDTRSLANGGYEYSLSYTRSGESTPSAQASGTFSINGNSGSLTAASGSGAVIETVRPVIGTTSDRWGNVLRTTDPRNAEWVTVNRYDRDNKLIEQTLPTVDVWAANGVASSATPIVRSYYDAVGRAIATVDANGNVNTVRYDAAGQMTSEYHADGGVVRHQYDIFGRKVRTVDAVGNSTDYQYDREDRLVKQKRPIGEENYAYDSAGNRIRETNALGKTTAYWYDARGKAIRARQPLGQEITYAYDARGNKIREFNANGDTQTWTYDYAGHLLGHVDLGGASFSYTYSQNGKLLTQTSSRGQNLAYSYYENGLLKKISDFGPTLQLVGNSVSIVGNGITKTSGTGWGNSDAYSAFGLTGDAYVAATAGQTNMYGMFGLNSDPKTDQNYTSLDYAWYPAADGKAYIYENGSQIGSYGSYATSDVFSVTYEGSNVIYKLNGVVKRTVATTTGRTFYFDSALYTSGFKLNNIEFRRITSDDTFYEYDAAGNRTRERYTKGGVSYQDSTLSFDSLGRMTQVRDNRYTLTYSYDANGNRRRAQSSYYDENNVLKNVDNWYLYDSMNRIALSQGALSNGVIQLDASANPNLLARSGTTFSGNTITKTAATGWNNADVVSPSAVTGQAYASATVGQTNLHGMFGLNSDPILDQNYTSLDYAWYAIPGGALYIYENGGNVGSFGTYTTSDVLSITYEGTSVVYKLNGVVKRTVATTAGRSFSFDSSLYDNGFKFNNVHFGTAAPKGVQLAYDAAGNRRTATTLDGGYLSAESYNYDANNRLVSTARAGSTTSLRSYDAAGQVLEQTTFSSPGTVSERRVSNYNSNGWVTEQNVYNGSGTRTQRTLYTAYDGVGNNTNYQVSVYTGTNYTNYYATSFAKFDSYKESKVAGTSTYFQAGATTTSYDQNGNITAVSETFATSKNRTFVTDQAGHILQKTENGKTQYYFYGNDKPLGDSGALSGANFDYNYTPVSDQFPGNIPGSYVVSAGDTLRGIALAMFGDAQLWYLIADANGLKSDSDLQVGRNLVIPNKVTNLRNASDTFQPYAPGKIIGDTTPTLPNPPPPPKPKGKKGKCGGVGGIITAVIAIVATVFTAGAAAIAMSAVSSATAASMGVMGVGMAAMGGSLGTSALLASFAAAAFGNVIGQGVGIALGVQDKFSWRSLALAAVSAAVGGSGVVQGVAGSVAASTGSQLLGQVAGAVVGNVITQGVGIAIGAQKSFSWTGVAAAGVGAGVGQLIGEAQYGSTEAYSAALKSGQAQLDFGNSLVRNLGSGVASRVVAGGKMNWGGVAADAFGNTLGSYLIESTVRAGQQLAQLQTAERESNFPGINPNAPSGQGLRLDGGGLAYAPSLESGAGGTETDSSRVRTVTVRAGDTLTRVAGTSDPQTLDQIAEFNGLRSRHEIRAGQTLNIPDGEMLSRISVSGSVAARGAAGAAYYADLQQQRAEMAAQAATTNYGNEGRSVPVAIVAAQSAGNSAIGIDGWDYGVNSYNGPALVGDYGVTAAAVRSVVDTGKSLVHGLGAVASWVNDSGWQVLDVATAGSLSRYLPEAQAALDRQTARGETMVGLAAGAVSVLSHPVDSLNAAIDGVAGAWDSNIAKPYAAGDYATLTYNAGRVASEAGLLVAPFATVGRAGEVGRIRELGEVLVANSEVRGARGLYSTREFDPAAAGGPLRELSADNIRFTESGVSVVEKHTARFGPDPANEYMTNRLRQISNGEIEATAVDRNFYSHELREYVRYRRQGWESGQPSDPAAAYRLWNNTHTATLEEYRILGPNTDPRLYHPNAIKLMGGN